MNWLNLRISILRHPSYIGAEPAQRAAWLNVLAYCCEQENGGRIANCRVWKDRQWQQTCGVTLPEIEGAEPLLSWRGNDLLVWEYPSDKEAEVQAKRDGGRVGGKAKHKQSDKDSFHEPDKLSLSSASNTASTEGEGERNRKEKEKKNGKELFCSEASPSEPKEPVLIFPCSGPVKTWHLTEQKLAEWQDTYPEMDVLASIRKSRQWCIDNPAKKKTANGMTQFIGRWLGAAQNKGEYRRGPNDAPRAYWTPTHPDAFRPQDEVLREVFKQSHGNNPLAARIIEKLEGMKNGEPAPL